jgi:hypothetical protein
MVADGQQRRISNDSVCAAQAMNSLAVMSGQGRGRTADLPLSGQPRQALGWIGIRQPSGII